MTVNLSEVFSITDVLDQVKYELNFGNVPGGGDTRPLLLRCHTAALPGIGNQVFQTFHHGKTLSWRGMKTSPHTFTASFYESVDAPVLGILRKWHEFVVGTDSNNSGGYKSQYAVKPEVTVFDTTGKPALTDFIYHCWPSDIPDVNLSSESSAAVDVTVTFAYDEVLSTTHSIR